jgi:hypothetical protein
VKRNDKPSSRRIIIRPASASAHMHQPHETNITMPNEPATPVPEPTMDNPQSPTSSITPETFYIPSILELPFKASPSTTTNLVISILTLPFQGLAILLVSRFIQQLVLCIDELYEIAGRRARSQFATFPWGRLLVGALFMAVYHVGLFRLTVRSWKVLRRGNLGGG